MPGFVCYAENNFDKNIELNMNNLKPMKTKEITFDKSIVMTLIQAIKYHNLS